MPSSDISTRAPRYRSRRPTLKRAKREDAEKPKEPDWSDDLLLQDRTFPEPGKEGLQMELYRKREMYSNHIPIYHIGDAQDRIDAYVAACNAPLGTLRPTQSLISNMINPDTPYTGLLIDHGAGTGKTILAHSVAKKFFKMVDRYGNRIIVLTPGPNISETHRDDIIKSMGIDIKRLGQAGYHTREALNAYINRYYQIMSYEVLKKLVMGELIPGQEERELPINHIKNLDNSLLIVDEAHNIIGNERGEAVRQLVMQSRNLKVLLLSATPMNNFADKIVEMINILRPAEAQIDRDKVFVGGQDRDMKFRSGGEKYLRKMVQGYVSYLRGRDPLTFSEEDVQGESIDGLDFVKVVPCEMSGMQLRSYLALGDVDYVAFHRDVSAASLLCLPGMPIKGDSPDLIGYYGNSGINAISVQLKHQHRELSDALAKYLAKDRDPQHRQGMASKLIYLDANKRPAGKMFHMDYLPEFSTKFAEAIQQIGRSVDGQDGPGLQFVYCGLVETGVEMFQQALLANGYLEYQDKGLQGYSVKANTRCYRCGVVKKAHGAEIKHKFYPAVFLSVTGQQADDVSDTKYQVIRNVFNKRSNRYGKYIKVLSGSKVVQEGITFSNIKDILYLVTEFDLGKTEQIDGRGIRWCSHSDLVTIDNPRPKVRIFRYVSVLPPKEMRSRSKAPIDLFLYQSGEKKYRLVKQVERILAEEAVDCPLNRGGNIFPEEADRYKGCVEPWSPEAKKPGALLCPSVCGYQSCNYKCGDQLLNARYYDPTRAVYRMLGKKDLDYSTYTPSLAREEIDAAKAIIRKMYSKHYVYQLDEIVEYIKNSQPDHIRSLFDPYYVYRSLTELIPITEDDFNQYDQPIYDKYQRPGYLIHVNRYYLFQPQEEPESLPAYYRERYIPRIYCSTHVDDYLRQKEVFDKYRGQAPAPRGSKVKVRDYDFRRGAEYYKSRDEAPYVGIIDSKNLVRNQDQTNKDIDEFKVRVRLPPNTRDTPIREVGKPTRMGSVCSTSKSAEFLAKMAKSVGIKAADVKRETLCDMIKDRLHHMELYSTAKDKNKVTYLVIPYNHPDMPFPLNLEDRATKFIDSLRAMAPEVSATDFRAQLKRTSRNLGGPKKTKSASSKTISGPLQAYEIEIAWPQAWLSKKAAESIAQRFLSKATPVQQTYRVVLQ